MTLSKNWFCEGYIDFELKQYQLLAYLQKVDKLFSERKLYTSLSELMGHYQSLMAFQLQMVEVERNFHYEIQGMDLETKQLKFKQHEVKQKEIDELKSIITFALDHLKEKVMCGSRIYDDAGRDVRFFDIGMVTLNKNEGYLIILHLNQYYIYSFKMSALEYNKEKHRGLNLKLVDQFRRSFVNTFENIKLSLLRDTTVDNPSVFGTDYLNWVYPYNETVLPVIKREFMMFLKKKEQPLITNI